MRRSIAAAAVACATFFGAGNFAAGTDEPPLQSLLDEAIAWLRNRDHNPAIAALVQIKGEVAAESVVGNRAVGHPELATIDDRWHIGSDTKAFTATLICTLADQQLLRLDDTLEASLPKLAKTIHPEYRRVTLRQLLSHTAGLPPLKTDEEFATALKVVRGVRGVSAQRIALARYYLSRRPASTPGTFSYSNIGYVIAGAVAETRTGDSWENLLRARVFAPLGIDDAGFGPPGQSGKYDQPLGHGGTTGLEPLDPADPASDNPAWIGPAGTINISLKDWAAFAQDQLDGPRGRGKLLRQATYRELQTPVTGQSALGWGVALDADGKPKVLGHLGSNGYWKAQIRIYPQHETFILIATNFGSDAADKTIDDLDITLVRRLKLID